MKKNIVRPFTLILTITLTITLLCNSFSAYCMKKKGNGFSLKKEFNPCNPCHICQAIKNIFFPKRTIVPATYKENINENKISAPNNRENITIIEILEKKSKYKQANFCIDENAQKSGLLKKLPDELIFKIIMNLDTQTFNNIRLINKNFKSLSEQVITKINFNDFLEGKIPSLRANAKEKMQNILKKINNNIHTYGHAYIKMYSQKDFFFKKIKKSEYLPYYIFTKMYDIASKNKNNYIEQVNYLNFIIDMCFFLCCSCPSCIISVASPIVVLTILILIDSTCTNPVLAMLISFSPSILLVSYKLLKILYRIIFQEKCQSLTDEWENIKFTFKCKLPKNNKKYFCFCDSFEKDPIKKLVEVCFIRKICGKNSIKTISRNDIIETIFNKPSHELSDFTKNMCNSYKGE